MSGEPGRERAATLLRWGGWGVALACIYLRALVGQEMLPYWDLDPMRMVTTPTGLTPAWSQIVDAYIIAASGLALIGEALAGRGVGLIWTALALIGAAGVWFHAVQSGADSLDQGRIGLTWVAAISAGLAAMHLCRDERLRRLTLAVSVSLVFLLAAKGVLQVTVEHQDSVARYRANPDSFLAAQGWAKDSAQARSFVRRLSQAEATAWFGLANVFASLAAMGLVALVGWSVMAWDKARRAERSLPDGWAGVLSIGALAAAAGVALAGSKGGATAAGIGLSLLAGGMVLGRQGRGPLARILTPRAGGLLAVALVLSALVALALRGAVGERVGELSLLFRWFYIQGAGRIMVGHPLGVGPAGFKDAYMLAKPPMSPEEVQSPHSVMFDYAATLGAFGVAWVGLWLAWVYLAGAAAARGICEEPRVSVAEPVADRALSPARVDGWAALVLTSAPALASAWMERTVTTPEGAVTRLVGLAGWAGVSIAALALMRIESAWRWAAAVAAIALAVHCQIEVTPVWAGSACLVMVILASVGAGAWPGRPRPWTAAVAGMSLIALAGAWVGIRVPSVMRWEHQLHAAAAEVRPLGELSMRLDSLVAGHGRTEDSDSMAKISADAAALAGVPAPTNGPEFERLMTALAASLAARAAPHLEAAATIEPMHGPTIEALSRITVARAAAESVLGRPEGVTALGEQATRYAEALVRGQHPPTASAASSLGTVWTARAEIERKPEYLNRALEAWQQAAALDPYGIAFPMRIMRTLTTLGRADEAKTWARKVLDLDTLQRLDPLKGLTPEEREEAERTLKGP